MRVTHKMQVDNMIYHASESLERFTALQEKTASGKQFRYASDNPANAMAALSIRSTLQRGEAYLETGYTSNGWFNATDSALAALENIGTRAINLALQGTTDTMGTNERIALATEMEIILQQALDAGNTTHQGSYIFAGFQTNTVPFTLIQGTPDTVTYNGNPNAIEEMTRNISPEQSVVVNVDGKVLHDPNNPADSFFNAIIRAKDALAADDRNALEAALADLRRTHENIKNVHTAIGARQKELMQSIQQMEKSHIELKALLSKKEDANMAEAISMLQQQETVYRTVLQVGNRALATMSLFDFME